MDLRRHNPLSKVSILMSTYNGQSFLNRQIDSILAQSYENLVLMIRDDGSTDATLSIVSAYSSLYPEKVIVMEDDLGNLRSTQSFLELLRRVDNSSYLMFSDQDDIWHPNKVEYFVRAIKAIEISNSAVKPALVFGDMTVVDEKCQELSSSFWAFQKLNPHIIFNWKKLLSQNVVTGCSMIINDSARMLCVDLPRIEVIHDHFIAINISKYGRVDYISEPTMLYVQHQNNVVGASAFDLQYLIKRMRYVRTTWSAYYALCRHFKMNFLLFIYFKMILNIKRGFN